MFILRKHKTRNKKRLKKIKYKKFHQLNLVIIFLFICFTIIVFIIIYFNNKMLPQALTISHIQVKNTANEIIDFSLLNLSEVLNITANDFLLLNRNDINLLSANTLLINDVCRYISQRMNEKINIISEDEIYVPLGALMDIAFLSNFGPLISFIIRPMGDVYVDYKTEFISVGVNQTNFKIWLDINLTLQIVNPIEGEKITVSRKVMLVDSIIKGDVPNSFLEF